MSRLRVAGHWFERRSLANGVTWLWEPHVHPLLRCNIWHVAGRDKDLLVDSGLGVASVRDAIADLADKSIVAVASHIHYDHVGGLHEFEERVMHRAEAAQMTPYREFADIRTSEFPAEMLEILEAEGQPVEGEYFIDALPAAGFDPDAYAVTPVSVTREVEEGDRIDLGRSRRP